MYILLGIGLFLLLAIASYAIPYAYIKARSTAKGFKPAVPLHHYGQFGLFSYISVAVFTCIIGSICHVMAWVAFHDVFFLGVISAAFFVTLTLVLTCLDPTKRAHMWTQHIIHAWLFFIAACSVIVTLLIVVTVLWNALSFFDKVPLFSFLFGIQWNPQRMATSTEAFGVVPLLTGTLLITAVALCFAGPIGLLSALYLSENASQKARRKIKPALEVLSGIPTVVYGYLAATMIGPSIADFLSMMSGDYVSAESALSAGLVMGIMISPIIISLSDDALQAVPYYLREASIGIGATETETALRVTLPTALPGVIAAFLLAISRAIGETMIVVMAAGLVANLSINPLEPVTTMTVQIVHMLVGDQEFGSAKTQSAYAIGLTLFVLTWILNHAALKITRRYKHHL